MSGTLEDIDVVCVLQVKAALAAAELDEGEGLEFPAPGAALAKAPCSLDTAWPVGAAVQLWPLGLVLAAAPVSARGPRRVSVLLSCLRGLQGGSRGALGCGITSIRALPQVHIPLPAACTTWSLGTAWESISHLPQAPLRKSPLALGGGLC